MMTEASNRDKRKITGLGKLLALGLFGAQFYDMTIEEDGSMEQEDPRRAADKAAIIEVHLQGTT